MRGMGWRWRRRTGAERCRNVLALTNRARYAVCHKLVVSAYFPALESYLWDCLGLVPEFVCQHFELSCDDAKNELLEPCVSTPGTYPNSNSLRVFTSLSPLPDRLSGGVTTTSCSMRPSQVDPTQVRRQPRG